MNKGVFEMSEEGTPQGGPLSPLLSNIMLNELDKELEHRGLPFVRYADDSMIFCKSERAAMRVKESITRYIEGELYLKVNKEKTVVSYVSGWEIPRLLLLCKPGQMPTCGTPKSQSQDESQAQGVDFPKQWMGICQEKAEAYRVHKRLGRLLPPSQYETTPYGY